VAAFFYKSLEEKSSRLFFLLFVSDGRVLRGMVIRLMGFIWLISLRGYGLNSMGLICLICLMGLIEPISLMGLIRVITLIWLISLIVLG